MPTAQPISSFATVPVPNEDKNTLIIVFLVVTNALCLIFTCLRVITRAWIVGARLWYDDWLTIAACLGTLVGGALDGCEIHYGLSRPEKYLDEHELLFYGAYAYCEWIQTFFTLCCTKLALCTFLLRIHPSRKFIRPLQASIVVLVVSHLTITFIWIFQCWPVQAAWDSSINGRCFGRHSLLNLVFSQAIISVVSDFALALVPIIILRRVQMRKRQKVGLCILMGLGIIVGTCCTIRTALNGGALPLDATSGGITNWFWRLFEVQLGIICACIPPLIPGYKWAKQKISNTLYGSGSSNMTSDQVRRQQTEDTFLQTFDEASVQHPKGSKGRAFRALDGSVLPRSEKALMGRAFQEEEESSSGIGSMYKKGSDDCTTDTERPTSMRTFFENDSGDKLGPLLKQPFYTPSASSGSPPPAAHIPSMGNSRRVSFTHRFSNSQNPHLLTPPPLTDRSRGADAAAPSPTGHMVTTTGDPSRSLHVSLQPRFNRNRRAFSRALDLNRGSWMSWFTSSSSASNNSTRLESDNSNV